MKKKNFIKVLSACALTFAVAGGVSMASNVVNAETTGVVSILENKLFIDDVEITAASANFETWHKASIRYDATKVEVAGVEYEQTGMRFLSWIDKDVYAALMASRDYTLTLGTIVANEKKVNAADDFTKEALANTATVTNHLDVKADKIVDQDKQESGEQNVEEFSAIVYGISEANYTTARMARAYMTVTSTVNPEESVTIYATRTTPAEGESDARSVADVAYSVLEQSNYDFTDEDFEAQYAALCKYAQKHEEWAKYTDENQQEVPYTYMAFVDNITELQYFAGAENTCIQLVGDIDASKATWTVGVAYKSPASVVPELKADLNGNGYKIEKASLSEALPEAKEDNNYDANYGFFGIITGNVSNLWFEGSLGSKYEKDGTTYITKDIVSDRAGLFAWKNEGTIKDCYIKGAIYNYHPVVNNAAMSIGVVFMNTGNMVNVLTDLYTATACQGDTIRAERYGFAFAVSNTGKVENCVTVTSQYKSELCSDGKNWIRSRTTSGFGTEYDATVNQYTWLKNANILASGNIYPSFPNGGAYSHSYGWNTAIWGDANRSNCYVFHRYEDLMSDTGVGYNDDHKVELPKTADEMTDTNKKASNSYVQKTGANGKAALGSAWTFTADSISLCGRVIYSK